MSRFVYLHIYILIALLSRPAVEIKVALSFDLHASVPIDKFNPNICEQMKTD